MPAVGKEEVSGDEMCLDANGLVRVTAHPDSASLALELPIVISLHQLQVAYICSPRS